MPTIEELNEKNIIDIETAREFFNDETISIRSFATENEWKRYQSLKN